MNKKILDLSLLAGVAIFSSMAVAHFLGLKIPLLFIYYDTPFHAYQDKIISFCLVTYACFLYAATKHNAIMPMVLVALSVTVLGLAAINVSDALASVLDGRSTLIYWAETGVFAVYLGWLFLCHRSSRA